MKTVRVITLPNGHRVTLGEYVRSWRMLKTLPPGRLVANFSHFPETAASILDAISHGVHHRISLRGSPDIRRTRDASHYVARRIRDGRLIRSCKWCGSEFKPANATSRFCDPTCATSYS